MINKNNANYDGYLNVKRKIRKSKGITGSLLYNNKRFIKKKIQNKIKKFEVNRNPIKIGSNRIRSSIIGSGKILNLGNILSYIDNERNNGKIDEIIVNKKIYKSKTIDLHISKHINIIKQSYLFGFVNENKIIKRQNSDRIIVNIKKVLE